MNREDTIAGVATAVGVSGIGVVRVSGFQAFEILELVAPRWRRRVEPRRLRLSWVVHPETHERVDQALVVGMPGPRSYTGEDVAELQTHGGPAVIRGVLAAVRAAGARAAEPGEFTFRAFLNGRLDLAQAEAVAAVVESASDGARRAALRQLAGGLSKVLSPLRQRCVGALAEIEARLDFPEEEVPPLDARWLLGEFGWLRGGVADLIRQGEAGVKLREGLRVVLLGRPNVGKSSLLNRLLGRPRAIVDSEPGTTRDYLEGEMVVEGVRVSVVDTAGQRPGARGPEGRGAAEGLAQASVADLVLVVVNLAEGVTAQDVAIMDGLGGARWGVVVNQLDRVNPGEARRCVQEVEQRGLVLGMTSAVTGEGIDALRAELVRRFAGESGGTTDPVVGEGRQLDVLGRCLVALERAEGAVRAQAPNELVAADLREALGGLGALLGVGVGEEVLETIFGRFCIGK